MKKIVLIALLLSGCATTGKIDPQASGIFVQKEDGTRIEVSTATVMQLLNVNVNKLAVCIRDSKDFPAVKKCVVDNYFPVAKPTPTPAPVK